MSRNCIKIGDYVSVGVKTPEGIDRGCAPKVDINWSALGSVDIQTAREFSNALRRAINRAQKELRRVRADYTSNVAGQTPAAQEKTNE